MMAAPQRNRFNIEPPVISYTPHGSAGCSGVFSSSEETSCEDGSAKLERRLAYLQPISSMEFNLATDSVLVDPGAVGGAKVLHVDLPIFFQANLRVKPGSGRVSAQDDVVDDM